MIFYDTVVLGACPTIGNLGIDTAITCSRAILWRQARQHEMLQLPMSDSLLDTPSLVGSVQYDLQGRISAFR